MRIRGHGWWLVALLISPGLVQAATIGWQEAVARLAYERTRAVTCARALQQHGNEAARRQGALAYGAAKAEIDAVIAGLMVALAQAKAPTSLPDLEARLQRGVTGRAALCATVMPLLPDTSGERSTLDDLVSGTPGPLLEAVTATLPRPAPGRSTHPGDHPDSAGGHNMAGLRYDHALSLLGVLAVVLAAPALAAEVPTSLYERPVLVLAPEMHTSPSGAPMSRSWAATQSPGPRTGRCGSEHSQTVG